MKRLFPILALLLITNNLLISQHNPEYEYWYQMIPVKNPDYSQIFSVINNDLGTANDAENFEGSSGMVAIRWQHFWRNRIHTIHEKKFSGFLAADRAIEKFITSKEKYMSASPTFSNEWKYIGRDSSVKHCMGIVFSVGIDTTDPDHNTIYAGTNASGLWKTENGGNNWYNVTDCIGLPGLGVNDVVIDPANSNTIYICTGLTTFFRSYGIGIWKSQDAGNSWEKIWGSDETCEVVSKLLIDPQNTNNLFTFINDKVYRSQNAGQDWHLVFDKLYQPYSWKTRRLLDGEFKPGSSDTIFILSEGTKEYLADTIINYKPEIWQCNNATNDSLVWTRIDDTTNWPYTNRASIAVSYAETDFLYCSFTYNDKRKFGLYRYSINDRKWHKKVDTTTENFLHGIDIWRNELLVSPSDTSVFYVGGYYVSKITGDNNISQSGTYLSDNFHIDVRDMKIVRGSEPGSNGKDDIIFVANDGGVSKTDNGAASWNSINGKGLRITQYYDLAASEIIPDYYAAGAQDNGLVIHNPEWDNPWRVHNIADNYSTVIDHTNPDFIYSLLFTSFPGMHVSSNGGYTVSQVSGYPSNERVIHGWPLIIDPVQSGKLYTGLRDGYVSQDYAYTWDKISDFTLAPHSVDSNQTIEDLRVFRDDSKIIYIAYSWPNRSGPGKKVFKTIDGGENWTDVSVNLDFLQYLGVTSIDIHPTDHNKVWLTLGGFSNPDELRVIYTDNSFNTYVDVSEGLPNLPVSCIKVNNTSLSEAFLCNDAAVYYRNDTMNRWEKYGVGMPVCIVSDLEIDNLNNKIRISTFGRGLWEIDGMNQSFSIPEGNNTSQKNTVNIYNIYPVPSSNEITVVYELMNQTDQLKLNITDFYGRRVHVVALKGISGSKTINMRNLEPGMYFANFIVNDHIDKTIKVLITDH